MTPQPPPGIPQHIQIEMARRELAALKQQLAIAENGIAMLSSVSAELSDVDPAKVFKETKAILAALVALVSLRLLELQNSHGALVPRIGELENALKVADSGIVMPGMRVKN